MRHPKINFSATAVFATILTFDDETAQATILNVFTSHRCNNLPTSVSKRLFKNQQKFRSCVFIDK